MTVPTQLYRHFDGNGSLLYVGISLNAVARLAQHRQSSWFGDIARIEVEEFPTREAALIGENLAIVKERPRHNKKGAAIARLTLENLDSIREEEEPSDATFKLLKSVNRYFDGRMAIFPLGHAADALDVSEKEMLAIASANGIGWGTFVPRGRSRFLITRHLVAYLNARLASDSAEVRR